MKKHILYIIALSALAFAGCQKSELQDALSGDGIIRFAPSVALTQGSNGVKSSATRATLINDPGSEPGEIKPLVGEFAALTDNTFWVAAWDMPGDDGQSVEGYMIFKAKNDADKGKYTLKNPVYVPVATYSESDTHIFLPFSGFITGKTVRSGNIDNGDAGKTAGYYLTSTTGQVALTDSHAGHAGFERVAVGVSKPTLATVPRHVGMPVRAVKTAND